MMMRWGVRLVAVGDDDTLERTVGCCVRDDDAWGCTVGCCG